MSDGDETRSRPGAQRTPVPAPKPKPQKNLVESQPSGVDGPPASGWFTFATAMRALFEGAGPYVMAAALLWMVAEKHLSDELGQVVVGAIVAYFFNSRSSRARGR